MNPTYPMENRIDLAQFEGLKEWEVEKRPDGGYAIKTGRDNFSLEEAETIVKLPELIAELKKCYYEIDLLRDYAKCVECSGQYIGPMDYGLHEWDHSADCVYASE